MTELEFSEALVRGVPLFWLVMALVTLLGKLGVSGRWQLACALGLGLLLGVGYQASLAPLSLWTDWFGAGLYGLALGLTASGVYETGKKLVQ